MVHPGLDKKLAGVIRYLRKNNFLSIILPVVIGVLAIIWFLIRVIPKPSRASYPCMKLAYPLMSGLVIWLLGITGIYTSFKLIVKYISVRKYIFASISVLSLLIFGIIHITLQTGSVAASPEYKDPVHIANEPFGEATGIVPGRVIWNWNPEATNENCTNNMNIADGYFLDKNNNQDVIDKMLSDVMNSVSDRKNIKESWNALFTHFNSKKGRGETGYKNDQTIFIKVNYGCANWNTKPDLTRKDGSKGYAETSPQLILSLLRQLVNTAGVPQERIFVADPMAHIYSDVFDILHNEFPDVKYGDKASTSTAIGRTLLTPEKTPALIYSDKGTVLTKPSDCLYSEMQNADYLINISALKAHGCAGVTFTAKNHFGSIASNTASHLHAALVGSRNDQPYRVDYGMYRIQVDLMSSKYLGGNTLLYIVDGLWGGTEATETPVKWQMPPFNNDWPSSLFASLDPVALESVCFDFLRYETKIGLPQWKNRANMAQGVDDYLHQAASKENWPKDITYDPDNSGKPISSLGIHEHWNNPVEKNYSRNLGKSTGIELVKISAVK